MNIHDLFDLTTRNASSLRLSIVLSFIREQLDLIDYLYGIHAAG